jgi:hypothetical protein
MIDSATFSFDEEKIENVLFEKILLDGWALLSIPLNLKSNLISWREMETFFSV